MIFSVVSVLSSCNLLDYTIYFLLLQDRNGGNVGFFVCMPLPFDIAHLPWVFPLAFLFLGCHHIAIALWYIVGRILNMCFAHTRPPRPRRGFSRLFLCSNVQIIIFIKRNYEFSVIKSCIPFTQQLIYATLNATHLSSF